jgi:hypothetical protein
MKLNKQRLMEMAGLSEDNKYTTTPDNANIYKNMKGYIAVYRVMGQDFTVGPLKTNNKQEVLDMLGNAIVGGFRLIDIVPTDQFKGVEKYGGLMLEDRVDEIQLGITNPNDDEALESVLDKASFEQNQSIEDAYHAIQDNLPFLIKDLEELDSAKGLSSDPSTQAKEQQAIRNEVKIYKDIQVLMDMSALGKLL